MVWYKLKIGLWDIRYTPIKSTEKTFPLCDKDGNAIEKVFKKGESYFVDGKGEKVEKAYRLINNKPMDKLSKTKEVSKYIEVDEKELEDLLVEKQYIIDSPLLLRDLTESGKCLKFGFTNGNGYKVFKAYVHKSKLYPDFLFMSLGITQKSEVIADIVNTLKDKEKSKNIEVCIAEVDKAQIEDLIAI